MLSERPGLQVLHGVVGLLTGNVVYRSRIFLGIFVVLQGCVEKFLLSKVRVVTLVSSLVELCVTDVELLDERA